MSQGHIRPCRTGSQGRQGHLVRASLSACACVDPKPEHLTLSYPQGQEGHIVRFHPTARPHTHISDNREHLTLPTLAGQTGPAPTLSTTAAS